MDTRDWNQVSGGLWLFPGKLGFAFWCQSGTAFLLHGCLLPVCLHNVFPQCLPDSVSKFPLSHKNACHGGLKLTQMTTFGLVPLYSDPVSNKVTFRSYGLLASFWGLKIINTEDVIESSPKQGFLVVLFVGLFLFGGKTLVFSFLNCQCR